MDIIFDTIYIIDYCKLYIDSFKSFSDIYIYFSNLLTSLHFLLKITILFITSPILFIFILPVTSLLIFICCIISIYTHPYIFKQLDSYYTFINLPKVYTTQIQDICSICLEEFPCDSVIYQTSCKHYFHIKCLDKYLTINANNITCPICRKKL